MTDFGKRLIAARNAAAAQSAPVRKRRSRRLNKNAPTEAHVSSESGSVSTTTAFPLEAATTPQLEVVPSLVVDYAANLHLLAEAALRLQDKPNEMPLNAASKGRFSLAPIVSRSARHHPYY